MQSWRRVIDDDGVALGQRIGAPTAVPLPSRATMEACDNPGDAATIESNATRELSVA